jgi:hypothetical protein
MLRRVSYGGGMDHGGLIPGDGGHLLVGEQRSRRMTTEPISAKTCGIGAKKR